MININPGERLDDLQIKGYKIIQNPEKFCFGMDSVLLSGFARIKPDEQVLDLGTGTGVLPLLLAAKGKGRCFHGLEIQEESVDMARRSVLYNDLSHCITIAHGDIKEASQLFGHVSFDVIITNPPYMIHAHGLRNPQDAKAIARHEVLCSLDDILRESSRILKPKGRFFMVHRPFRMVDIFEKMSTYGIEPKRIRLVHPEMEKEPNMILIEGLRGGNRQLTVEAPLVISKKGGEYTKELKEIYGI